MDSMYEWSAVAIGLTACKDDVARLNFIIFFVTFEKHGVWIFWHVTQVKSTGMFVLKTSTTGAGLDMKSRNISSAKRDICVETFEKTDSTPAILSFSNKVLAQFTTSHWNICVLWYIRSWHWASRKTQYGEAAWTSNLMDSLYKPFAFLIHVNSKNTDKHNFSQNSTVLRLLFQLLPLATHAQSRVKITGFTLLLSLLVFQLCLKTWKQFKSETILNPLQSFFIPKGITHAASALRFWDSNISNNGILSKYHLQKSI